MNECEFSYFCIRDRLYLNPPTTISSLVELEDIYKIIKELKKRGYKRSNDSNYIIVE